jgi:hypothetical protein
MWRLDEYMRCRLIEEDVHLEWIERLPSLDEMPRETREGWPLLTVETEVNGDSKSTNERVLFLVSSLGLSCKYKRYLSCLGCSCRPSTEHFFFFPYTILHLFVPVCL